MSYWLYALKCLKGLPRERIHVIYDFPIYFGFRYLNLLIIGRNRQLWSPKDFKKSRKIYRFGILVWWQWPPDNYRSIYELVIQAENSAFQNHFGQTWTHRNLLLPTHTSFVTVLFPLLGEIGENRISPFSISRSDSGKSGAGILFPKGFKFLSQLRSWREHQHLLTRKCVRDTGRMSLHCQCHWTAGFFFPPLNAMPSFSLGFPEFSYSGHHLQ